MKRILCFGDSNTWGHNPEAADEQELRYQENERWSGLLTNALQETCRVIEEGLCGRSTVFDDPLSRLCNGAQALPLCLKSHQPLDLVVLMLGTNDVRTLFHANEKEIRRGMEHLIQMIQSAQSYDIKRIPHILLIAPPLLGKEIENSYFYGIYDEDSQKKLKNLGAEYEKISKQYGCSFLDAGKIVKDTGSDGVHFTKEGHRKLYEAVLEKVNNIIREEEI